MTGDTLDAYSSFEYGMILLVKVVEDHTGSFPTGVRCGYKCLVCTPRGDGVTEGGPLTITEPTNTDRFIIAYGFRANHIPMNTYQIAVKVGSVYLIDNQNVFLEAL